MKSMMLATLVLLSFQSFAQGIKNSDNAIACLATNSATGEKSIISWTNVNYDRDFIQTVGADEKRIKMDKSDMNVTKLTNSDSSMNFELSTEREYTVRGTFSIDKKSGKGTLSKNLTSDGWDNNRFWLFPLSNFTCYSTTIVPGTTFKPNSFLRSLGLNAIDNSTRYSRVGCSELAQSCGTVKID